MEQLLKILENNARLPVEDIATMLNKSPAEVAAMMDLARAQGIIKHFNPGYLGHTKLRFKSNSKRKLYM